MRTRPALEVGAPELFVWVGLSKICHKKFVEAIDLHLGSGGGGRGEIIRSHDGGRSSDGAVLLLILPMYFYCTAVVSILGKRKSTVLALNCEEGSTLSG